MGSMSTASYNLLSSDMQNHMGSMNDFASGYKTTISNSVSNIHVISSTENQVIINYDLTAKDRANGNRVKIQYFNGTATLSNATGSWHIVDMTVKKTGEHME